MHSLSHKKQGDGHTEMSKMWHHQRTHNNSKYVHMKQKCGNKDAAPMTELALYNACKAQTRVYKSSFNNEMYEH